MNANDENLVEKYSAYIVSCDYKAVPSELLKVSVSDFQKWSSIKLTIIPYSVSLQSQDRSLLFASWEV